jgi:sigma-B regulation protein RsbU (phosphoserine phosphatase)
VGLIEGASYELSHIQLYAGDWVFIGSDGITEALNKKGEMFAEHGLCELLQRSRALSGDRLLERVVDEVTRFTGSNDPEDDLSAISLGFRAAQ